MSRVRAVLVLVAGCLLVAVSPVSAQGQGRGRGFGRAVDGTSGRQAIRVDRAPDAEALVGSAAIDALRGATGQILRERGEDPEQYVTLLEVDRSVRLGPEGHIVFLDAVDPDDTAIAPDMGAPAAASDSAPAPVPTALATNGLPLHHSKPGAPWTLYVDVESQTVLVSQAMRLMLNLRVSTITTSGLTLDADSTTFNVDEQQVVSRIWGRVAEDWAPFDVDVTTERPASFATSPWGGPRVIWNIVTRTETILGFRAGSLYGIAAAANLCGISTQFLGQPTFTFWANTGAANHSDLADTISHEAGHVVGLVHDGARIGGSTVEYYGGNGDGPTSWGPIMGSPIARNVTQWSAGDYPNASNLGVCGPGLQDDVAHIAQTFGRRADEAGNTDAEAAPLAAPTRAVITETTDVDVFALPRADDVRIQITPFRAGEQTDGGNLDVAAEIVNGAGLVVVRTDDVTQTAAELSALLPPGQHFLRVQASADPANYPAYGSLGQYTVTGTFISTVRLTALASPLPAEVLTPGRTAPVTFTLSDSVSAARVQLWSDESPAAAVLAEARCQAQQGLRQHCRLKLPKTLASGARYWIASQYQALDGQWVTVQVVAGAALSNPVAFFAR
jgi:hypothetical protein